jgi:hypothetical protein
MSGMASGIKLGKIVFLALLLINLYSNPFFSFASKQKNVDAEQFNKLYATDSEFKNAVDNIRIILSKQDLSIDSEWLQFQQFFNIVLTKLGCATLDNLTTTDLSDFRSYIEHLSLNSKLMALEKNYQTPVLPLMTDQQEINYAHTYVPLVRQPLSDVNGGQPLQYIFIDVFEQSIYGYSLPGLNIIEVSLVWADEDYPNNPVLDAAYDAIRLAVWGRIQDIETFFITVDRAGGLFYRVGFIAIGIGRPGIQFIDGCYSGAQTWTGNNHYEAKIDRINFSKTQEHVWINVNTWNHMLGNTQNNQVTLRQYQTWTEFTIGHGNRMVTENTMQGTYHYTSEAIYQSPY